MIKTGTFLCWLWGHVFIGEAQWLEDGPRGEKTIRKTQLEQSKFCVRCGIDKDPKPN